MISANSLKYRPDTTGMRLLRPTSIFIGVLQRLLNDASIVDCDMDKLRGASKQLKTYHYIQGLERL
jgi:hypothetical protein